MEKEKKIPINPLLKNIFSYLEPQDQIKIALSYKNYLNIFCSLYSIKSSQFSFFLQYLHLFCELKKVDPNSKYCNYPNEIDFYRIQSQKGVNRNTIYMAVAFYLNSLTSNSHNYILNISSEEELKAHINIIKHLNNANKYSFMFQQNQTELPIESLLELSKLLKRYSPMNYLDKVTKHCIKTLIPHDLYFVDLDSISIDKVIEYSTKFPNKIQRLQCNNENESKDKLKHLAMLNSISLVHLPNPFFELYTSCKNIKHVSFLSNDNVTIPNDFDCSNVESLDTIGFTDETLDQLIETINKFPNLKHLQFSTWCIFQNDSFFSFFKAINVPNLTKLECEAQFLDDDADFDFIINKFPKLKRFRLEEHESMDFSYKFDPVFSCEKTQMSMECLEKLIRNYLIKDNNTISLTLSQKSENIILDYFTPKKDIMSRIKQVYFYGPSNKVIESVKTLTINSKDIQGDIKHVDCLVVEEDINQKIIIDYVKKVTPIILDINSENEDLTLYQFLENIPSLRFILFKGLLKYVKRQNAFVKLDNE